MSELLSVTNSRPTTSPHGAPDDTAEEDTAALKDAASTK